MNDQKNILLAIVLSAVVLIGWQVFFGIPQMQRQKQTTPPSGQTTTQPGTPVPPGATPPGTTTQPGPPAQPGTTAQPGSPATQPTTLPGQPGAHPAVPGQPASSTMTR